MILPEDLIEIEGYDLIKAKTVSRYKYSRIVLLCKSGLIYNVEWDRMNDSVSSIWIRLGGRGRRGLLVGGVYREHSIIRQDDKNNLSDQIYQESRWSSFINQWKAAISWGPCLVIGDMNLNIMKWDKLEQINENMVEQTKDEISTLNTHQVIRGPTRFWNCTQPSLVDQCWGNCIENIFNIRNVTRGTADQNFILVQYRLCGKIMSKMETKGRDWKKIQ